MKGEEESLWELEKDSTEATAQDRRRPKETLAPLSLSSLADITSG